MPEWETISHQAVIGGFVRDAEQQPLADVAITAQAPDKEPILAQTRSREDGSYFLVDVNTGPYILSAEYQGLRRQVGTQIPDFRQEGFRMIWLDLQLPAKAE